MRCGYDIPVMILLQAYLYIYSLLGGVMFKSTLLEQLCSLLNDLPPLETFLELLL
jgi:hypothetical protein